MPFEEPCETITDRLIDVSLGGEAAAIVGIGRAESAARITERADPVATDGSPGGQSISIGTCAPRKCARLNRSFQKAVSGGWSPVLTLGLLGPLCMERDGASVPLPQSKKTRALLAYLAVSGRPQTRDRLCSLFWDQTDDPRGALRWSLSKLRPLVDEPGVPRIVSDRQTVAFDARDVDIDVVTVRRRVSSGLDGVDRAGLADLEALFRGTFLEGLHLPDCPDFEGWRVAERTDAAKLHIRILEILLERVSGDGDAALAYARRLVAADPHRPAANEALLQLLVEAGRRDEAERHYHVAVRRLEEVGGTPLHSLAQAWERLRRPTAAVHTPVSPASPEDPVAAETEVSADLPTGGEQKHATVVVVALGDASAALDSPDPEEALAALDPLREAVQEAVRSRGGTVVTVATDAVTAVFGAPVAQEDQAVRACHAALAIRDAVQGVSAGRPIVRIGLDTGDIVFRTVGGDRAVHHQLVGRAPLIAARVAAAVDPGEIGLTPATQRQADGFIDVAPSGSGDPRTAIATLIGQEGGARADGPPDPAGH